jgi:carboxymethylenebutenolidase
MPSTDPAGLAKLKAPVLMFWGTKDDFINAKVVSDFESAMKKARKPLKTHSFNAVHAFANPSNPKYDRAAEATSHKETLAFFRKHLK